MLSKNKQTTDVAAIMRQLLAEKGLSHLSEILSDSEFWKFWDKLDQDTPNRNTTTTFLGIFPALEYALRDHGEMNRENIFGNHRFFKIVLFAKKHEIIDFVRQYGMPTNVPQRAFMPIVFLTKNNLVQGKRTLIAELGCGSGLSGVVFENYKDVLSSGQRNNLFWLHSGAYDELPFQFKAAYLGLGETVVEPEKIPYFTWDQRHRKEIELFLETYWRKICSLNIKETDPFATIKSAAKDYDRVVILTSFEMYKHQDPAKYARQILKEFDEEKFVWLDISVNRPEIIWLASDRRLSKGDIYLSYNGYPEMKVIGQSPINASYWESYHKI